MNIFNLKIINILYKLKYLLAFIKKSINLLDNFIIKDGSDLINFSKAIFKGSILSSEEFISDSQPDPNIVWSSWISVKIFWST